MPYIDPNIRINDTCELLYVIMWALTNSKSKYESKIHLMIGPMTSKALSESG